MNKLRIYLIYGFFSTLIGVAIEVVSSILENKNSIAFSDLLESMTKGAFIGTVSLFFLFHVFMRFKNKPIAAYISNFTVIAVLMAVVALFEFIDTSSVSYRWYVAFITAEILGFIVTALWYRQMTLYNDKLKEKKASIED